MNFQRKMVCGETGSVSKKVGFAVAEQIRVTDDEIAQQQQREQKREQQIHQPLRQHRAQPGKFGDELAARRKTARTKARDSRP